jgi:hypothetical protein
VIWWHDHDEPGPEEIANQILALLAQGIPAALVISCPAASAAPSADGDRER